MITKGRKRGSRPPTMLLLGKPGQNMAASSAPG
jgi:hypothetical protein